MSALHSHISGQSWLRHFHNLLLWFRWRQSEAASHCLPAEWPCRWPHWHLNMHMRFILTLFLIIMCKNKIKKMKKTRAFEFKYKLFWSPASDSLNRIILSALKKVLSYQHRDSSEPARSCPVVSLVSEALTQAGKACPEPWSRQSPVNEICGGRLRKWYIIFSFKIN